MTKDQFQQASGISAGLAVLWHPHLLATFDEFGIDKPEENAMFIAHFGHESAGFSRVVVSFNYSRAGLTGRALNSVRCCAAREESHICGRQRQVPCRGLLWLRGCISEIERYFS